MGYSHLYLDPENAHIESLATYPTDGEISLIVEEAWGEAVTLLALLGIQANDLHVTAGPADMSASSDPNKADLSESPTEEKGVALQHLIGLQQTTSWEGVDSEVQAHMHMLTCAAVALDIEERRTL